MQDQREEHKLLPSFVEGMINAVNHDIPATPKDVGKLLKAYLQAEEKLASGAK